ncbi:MAG: hypothetical protein LBC50_01435 [Candidatus Ancillula sp.]|jgi:hypothetical protein|nr:hypothetical protein [Candidatus Ancillula sp.]
MRKYLTTIFVVLLILAGGIFPPAGFLAKAEALSSDDLSKWSESLRLNSSSTTLRTERYYNDDFLFYLSQGSDTLGVMKTDYKHNFSGAEVLQNITTGKEPYDVRFYRDYVIVGNRGVDFINIYKFHPDGVPSYIESVQKLSLAGLSPVKLFLNSARGLLYSPNQKSNSMSIVNLRPLKDGGQAELLTVIPVQGRGASTAPARIVGISNNCAEICKDGEHEVVLTFNDGTGDVTSYDVSDPSNPQLLNIIPTGPKPYYGEGNGEVFFVDSQGSDYLTALDMRNPLDLKLLETGSKIIVGDAPLIPQFVNKGKTVLWTIQGLDSANDPNAQGAVVSLDLSDAFGGGIVKTATIATRRGCGGMELIKRKEDGSRDPDTMLTINSPDGSISIIDIRDPAQPVLLNNLFLANGGEPHYVKITSDGHHMVASDRKNNVFVAYSDLDYGAPPIGYDKTTENKTANGKNVVDYRFVSANGAQNFKLLPLTPSVCLPRGIGDDGVVDFKDGDHVLLDVIGSGTCKFDVWQVMDASFNESAVKHFSVAVKKT